jgi:hypothetical protein
LNIGIVTERLERTRRSCKEIGFVELEAGANRQQTVARVGQRERFLTVIQDLSVLIIEATENDELYHELSIQKFTFHESDKPVVSPCVF